MPCFWNVSKVIIFNNFSLSTVNVSYKCPLVSGLHLPSVKKKS